MEIKSKFDLKEIAYHPFKAGLETLKIKAVKLVASLDGEGNTFIERKYDVDNLTKGESQRGYENISESQLFKTKKEAASKVLENMGMIVNAKDMKEREDVS